MKEYTHTKMKKVLTTIDSSRFIPAVWQRGVHLCGYRICPSGI